MTFYRDVMEFDVLFSNDWFVEFAVNFATRVSVIDETRASVKSCNGQGVTIAFEVSNIAPMGNSLEHLKTYFIKKGVESSPIRVHPWQARVFYVWDPEGHRIEFWTSMKKT